MMSYGLNIFRSVMSRPHCRSIAANEKKCQKVSFLCTKSVCKAMPPKMKRQRQQELILEKAKQAKRPRPTEEEPSNSGGSGLQTRSSGEDDLARLVTMPEDVLDTDDEDIDPSFDLDSSMKADTDHLEENFCEEWIHTSIEMTDCLWVCFCAFNCRSISV